MLSGKEKKERRLLSLAEGSKRITTQLLSAYAYSEVGGWWDDWNVEISRWHHFGRRSLGYSRRLSADRQVTVEPFGHSGTQRRRNIRVPPEFGDGERNWNGNKKEEEEVDMAHCYTIAVPAIKRSSAPRRRLSCVTVRESRFVYAELSSLCFFVCV